MSSTQPQVIVIGGGPGGSSAAGLLASWGHDVALIARPIPPAGWLAESIPASTWKLLDAVGMKESVETARFFPNGGNTVWWAGRPEQSEAFAGGEAGVHVERAALEEVMLAEAERRGVMVSRDAPVRSAERGARGWSVEWGDSQATAPWVLDASGRAGVVARRTRVEDRPTGTIALVGRWRREGGWGGDRTHTLIESYEDGWVWSVPVSNEVRCVTAMVDPRETDLERSGGIAAMLATELEKAPHIGARLDGARPDGDARACPASLYTSEAFAADGTILVGDAGSFIDPLSSYGVKKALASAWLAAVAVHTAIVDPSMRRTALDFFDSREREVYRRYREFSIGFFDEASKLYATPFWTARAEAARRAGGDAPRRPSRGEARDDPADAYDPSMDTDALVGDRDVREAYEELRRRSGVKFTPGETLTRVDLPVVHGNRIVLDTHFTSARTPRGVRYVRNVDVARVLEAAAAHDRVPDIFEAYNRSGPPTELRDFLAALAVAVGKGFLELTDWRPTARNRTLSG